MMATVADLFLSAQIILEDGNSNLILCERGIWTFETATRNTFDVAAIALITEISHLPVIADPSHAAGHRDLVAPLARTAVAAGADGLIVEVNPYPDKAWSDGEQSLDFGNFDELMTSDGGANSPLARFNPLSQVARSLWVHWILRQSNSQSASSPGTSWRIWFRTHAEKARKARLFAALVLVCLGPCAMRRTGCIVNRPSRCRLRARS